MMDGWKECRLGDLIIINPKSIGRDYPYNEINYYDISSVKTGYVETVETINVSDAPSRAKRIVKSKDTILSTVRPQNRSFFYFKQAELNDIASTGFAVLRAKHGKIVERYLYYLVSDYNFTGYLTSNEQGATYPAVTPSVIERAKIHLPPLSTQRKIASILSRYDDLIENNLKRIKLLEEMAQQTYEEWFVRMKFPGHETAKWDEETGLPEGWKKVKLGDVCKLTMGQSPKSEFYNYEGLGLPFHQGVKDYGDRFPTNTMWSSKAPRVAEEGDVLFSVRAPVGRLNIAFEKIILGRGLSAIAYKNNWNGFLYYQLKQLFFKDNLMGGGAIFNSVTKNDMISIKLIEGNISIMQLFDQFVVPIDRTIKNLQIQNQRLKEARDILLPRLMTGMIDVEGLEAES